MAIHETEDSGSITDYPLKNENYVDLLCRYTKADVQDNREPQRLHQDQSAQGGLRGGTR